MKYVVCPECGKRLFRTSVCETGARVEISCPKCGKSLVAYVSNLELRILDEENDNLELKTNKE